MKILSLVQGTKEWIEARLEHFTASEASAMMGDSKHMSRNELLALKKGWQSNPNSSFTERLFQKGHDFEDAAREITECELLDELLPIVGSIEVEGLLLLASFDGLTIDHVTAWEHKMWNTTLAENVRNGILEPHYYWQLEQQLLVSNADICIFTVSDGTTENYVSMEYISVPERRKALIAGWKQFLIDFDEFELKAKVEQVTANKIAKLPSLEVSLVGQVSNSNLVEYKSTALAFIDAIKTELTTDQDFKDANEAVKWLGNGEKELESVKERALSDTADIKALFETIDELKEEMRQKRLKLSKLTKSEKDRLRNDIAQKANQDYSGFIAEISKKIAPIQLLSVTSFDCDFMTPMKGKSSVESLQNSVDTKLAQLKIEVNDVIELITTNLNSLKELASEHKFLFSDTPQLVLKANDDLVNLIKARIAEHEQAEAERKRQEQERIELEAKEKAEHEAQKKLNAEREQIRAEEALKAKAEAEEKAVQQLHSERVDLTPAQDIQEALSNAIVSTEQTSEDKEVSPIQNEAVTLARNIHKEQSEIATFGEYEPLGLWPSDHDLSQSEVLARVSQKLEEAEAYIQILTANKAA